MQQAQKELLLEILKIIHYRDNKDKFIKEYEAMNYLEAITNMLERLPEQLRDVLRTALKNGNQNKIKEYVSVEEYNREVISVADEALKTFVETISPVLTLDQKQKIAKLLPH